MHTRSCKELQMNQFIRPQKPLSHIFKAAEIATTTTTTPVISCQQPRFLRLLCFKQWRCCAADAHENTQGNHSDSSKNMRDMHKKKKKRKNASIPQESTSECNRSSLFHTEGKLCLVCLILSSADEEQFLVLDFLDVSCPCASRCALSPPPPFSLCKARLLSAASTQTLCRQGA